MKYFHEWETPHPVNTPKGTGLIIASYDRGMDHHWYHMVILDENGKCWIFSNPEISFTENESYGRVYKEGTRKILNKILVNDNTALGAITGSSCYTEKN